MIFQRVSLFFFVVLTFLHKNVSASPVIIWSNANLEKTPVPLTGLTPENLILNSICKQTNSNLEIRIFAVENLEIEDLEERHGFLSYAQTANSKVFYYPEVKADPYKTFSSLENWDEPRCSQLTFRVVLENSYEQLNHALNAIQTNIDQIEAEEKKNVLIVVLRADSHRKSLSRHRRAASSLKEQVLVSDNKTCMFYARSLIWTTTKDDVEIKRNFNLALPNSECVSSESAGNATSKSATVNLSWTTNSTNQPSPLSLKLTATQRGSSWFLSSIVWNNITYRYFAYGLIDSMKTPWYFSYACDKAQFVRYSDAKPHGAFNFSDTFHLIDLQFQPFAGDGIQFGQVNYCTSFFTSGIWMGLTSSFLLLAILIFGIHRLMTIKANDRFDDPKGKPLNIKAQE